MVPTYESGEGASIVGVGGDREAAILPSMESRGATWGRVGAFASIVVAGTSLVMGVAGTTWPSLASGGVAAATAGAITAVAYPLMFRRRRQ